MAAGVTASALQSDQAQIPRRIGIAGSNTVFVMAVLAIHIIPFRLAMGVGLIEPYAPHLSEDY